MSDYITTVSGVHIDPMNPDPDKINIDDIAHSLAFQCRANAHFPRFYSVAQHCVDCVYEARARNLSKKMQLALLLHDAAEAYFSDMPAPVKKHFPQLVEAEEKLLSVIYIKYMGRLPSDAEQSVINEVDKSLFYHEFYHIMGEKQIENLPKLLSDPDFKTKPAIEMEEVYKRCFKRCTKKKNGK